MRQNRRAARVGAPAAWLLLAVPAGTAESLTFTEVAAGRVPHEREVRAEALLAEAAGAAAGSGGWLLEAPSASLTAGPRRVDDGATTSDVAVEVELPLAAGRHRRLDLATALDDDRVRIRAAGRAIALADLAGAYARAWLAQEEMALRVQDISIAEAWVAATERRVEAGADPPYESILVAVERDRALLDLLAARRDVELTWGELARLAAVPRAPQPLDPSSLPRGEQAAGAAVLTGIEASRDLAILLAGARSAAASSRWSVAGDAGREGEEELARLGVAYRFAMRGERAAIAGQRSSAEASATSEAAGAMADLRSRIAAAQVALRSTAPRLDAAALESVERALESRLAEGRERVSQVLPLRRQLLEAALAAAGARAARAQAAAELFFLDGGVLP